MNSTMEQAREAAIPLDLSDERSDEDLLLDYRDRGCRESFERLVHRYQRELYNYLRHYLGDAQMADDAFQTTFLQVHLKCGTFQRDKRVRPWLYTVATHQAIDAQRKNRRHRVASLDRRFGGDSGEEVTALVHLLDSGEPGPLERVEGSERDRLVREAVDRLPDALRQVVALVYYQGMKYREAAEVLSIPVGTVKSRLHAAVHRLHEALAETPLAGNE